MGNNLDHQEKVHEELDKIFSNSEVPANMKELSELKYLDRVLKEALRVYPSIPIIARKLAEDVQIGTINRLFLFIQEILIIVTRTVEHSSRTRQKNPFI